MHYPRGLTRLLSARSLAVIGDAAAAGRVIVANAVLGFDGPIWAVHPRLDRVGGVPTFRQLSELPAVPDAAFVAVPAPGCPQVVAELAELGCGGAVVYSSGFAEHPVGDDQHDLQHRLVEAAAAMPILGPNCYGFVNYADAVAIWPDQHGGVALPSPGRGVAVISQSSSIAISVTMQKVGLPLTHVVTVGNAAVLSPAAIASELITGGRVGAVGMIVESLSDVRGFEALAVHARSAGVGVVALVLGRSDQARRVVASHSASLASDSALASGFLARLGIGEVGCVDELLGALSLLHCGGPLPGASLASLSSSGGEAALIADTVTAAARPRAVTGPRAHFEALTDAHREALKDVLGHRVPLDNPLDYHTYAWADRAAMTRVFTEMTDGPADLTLLFADLPRRDRCAPDDWLIAVDAFEDACAASGSRGALVAAMGSNLTGPDAADFVARGLAVLAPPSVAVAAVEAAAAIGVAWGRPQAGPVVGPAEPTTPTVLDEARAKALLAGCGVPVPVGGACRSRAEVRALAGSLRAPLVVKALGPAHKTDVAGVVLGLTDVDSTAEAAAAMLERFGAVLVEEQCPPGVELIVAVEPDPVFGPVLTVGAGGVLTEVLVDVAQLVLPVEDADLLAALGQLRVAALLRGHRGKPGVDPGELVRVVQRLVAVVLGGTATSVEVNPVIVGPHGCLAVDALVAVPDEPDAPDVTTSRSDPEETPR